MSYTTIPSYTGLTPENKETVDAVMRQLIDIQVQSLGGTVDVSNREFKEGTLKPLLRTLKDITAGDFVAYRTAAARAGDAIDNQRRAAEAAARSRIRSNAALAQRLQQEELNTAAARAAPPTAANLAAIRAIQEANAAALRAGRGAVRALNTGPAPAPRPAPPPPNSVVPLLQNGNNGVPFGPYVGIEGFCPIVNGRNICYMNSSMQLLYSIPEVRTFFRNLTTQDIRQSVGNQDTKNAVELLRRFFVEMIKAGTEGHPLSLEAIKRPGERNLYTLLMNLLMQLNPVAFQVNQQADAHEFFMAILPVIFESPLLSPLKQLFLFKVQNVARCRDGRQSIVEEQKVDLVNLPLKDTGRASTIKDLITIYHSNTADNTPLNSCGGQPAESKHIITIIPDSQKYILFNIQRKYGSAKPKLGLNGKQLQNKDGHPVWEPYRMVKDTKKITLNPTIQIDGVKFRLKQCVCHLGGAAGGHYISYSFDTKGNPSYYFSDQDVHPILEADRAAANGIIEKNATVVLYEKLPGQRRAEAVNVNVLSNTPVALFGNSNANLGGKRRTRRLSSKKKTTRRH